MSLKFAKTTRNVVPNVNLDSFGCFEKKFFSGRYFQIFSTFLQVRGHEIFQKWTHFHYLSLKFTKTTLNVVLKKDFFGNIKKKNFFKYFQIF